MTPTLSHSVNQYPTLHKAAYNRKEGKRNQATRKNTMLTAHEAEEKETAITTAALHQAGNLSSEERNEVYRVHSDDLKEVREEFQTYLETTYLPTAGNEIHEAIRNTVWRAKTAYGLSYPAVEELYSEFAAIVALASGQ